MTGLRSYRCAVCGWHGWERPADAGDAAPCPQCGVFLYPEPWRQSWGLVVLLIAGTVGVVFGAAWLLR